MLSQLNRLSSLTAESGSSQSTDQNPRDLLEQMKDPSFLPIRLPAWLFVVVAVNPLVCSKGHAQDKFDGYWMKSYEMREKLVQDKFRPRYHFLPPEGRWNDINGAVFYKGRYHIGLSAEDLQRTGSPGFLKLAAHIQQRSFALALPQGLAPGTL